MAKTYEMPSIAPDNAQFFVAVTPPSRQRPISANQKRLEHHQMRKSEEDILKELRSLDSAQFGIVKTSHDDTLFDDE
jgi:hypothetical protein